MRVEYTKNNKFILEGCTYNERMIPKDAKWRWDPKKKKWWTDEPEKAYKLAEYCDETAKEAIESVMAKRQELIEASRATDANIDIPAPECEEYLPFQRAGVAYAMRREHVLIGDEMGLGKTIQAIGIINANPTIKRVLIICPASLRINWAREAQKWLTRRYQIIILGTKNAMPRYSLDARGGEPVGQITIINYDILKKHRESLRMAGYDLLIADECHYLKNPKAQRTKEVFGKWDRDEKKRLLPIPAKKRVYLTGTPIVNRPIELYPLLKSTGDPQWRSWKHYVTRYCAGYEGRWGWDVSGASNLDELQEKLRASLMVRRLKKEVLTELPPKRRQVIELPANGAQDTIDAEKSAWEGQQTMINELQAAVELAKASDNPDDYKKAVENLRDGYRAAFTEISRLRHETALAKVDYVSQHVIDAVEASGKVVLFCHHKDVVKAIMDKLSEAEIGTVLLHGDMSMQARQSSVDAFQQTPSVKVFIGTIGAAGVGITLTAASHVVFAELDWVPGNVSQAEDRCHRIGQDDSVLVQHLVLEGSLDARIANTLVKKQEVIDRALDVNAKKVDKEWGSLIEMAEVATKSLTKTKVAEAAEKITPKEIADIHDKLIYLASMCDGARELDGVGFNKFDSPIGKSLAASPSLSPKQAILGRRLVTKYKGQLGG